jgi:hypothetical protein
MNVSGRHLWRVEKGTYNVTRDKLAGKDVGLGTITDHGTAHGNVTLETGDDIGGLLLLVETDKGVEQQDGDNDTEINPILETEGKKSSNFHN